MRLKEIAQKDLDPITLQRTLKFAAQMDADRAMNPDAPSYASPETMDLIKRAREQQARQDADKPKDWSAKKSVTFPKAKLKTKPEKD